jgi:hypothetical protein
MSGATIQLVAVGAQDVYLTTQPQITYFKSVYRRHTNFAIDSAEQTISGTPNFGSRISVTIFRSGDLLKNIWLQYNPQKMLASITPATEDDIVGANVGHSIISQVDLEINGQIIDTQYGKWMTIWNYLTECDSTGIQGAVGPDWEEPGWYDSAVDYDAERSTRYNIMAYTHRANVSTGTISEGYLPPNQAYVPFRFWFCRNPGLAIPIISLQYAEIKVLITFGQANGVFKSINNTPLTGHEFDDLKVYADYIYLDSTERRQFAQNSHEYLIEQLQVLNYQTTETTNLYFKHPVKEIIWSSSPEIVARGNPIGRTDFYNVVPGLGSPSKEMQDSEYTLLLNGIPRTKRNLKYYTRNTVWDYHTGYGSILFPNSIAVYSFALRPEESQPSGSCNFSRIDTAQLVRSTTDPIDIYATNINVLRIMSGTAGLAYVN